MRRGHNKITAAFEDLENDQQKALFNIIKEKLKDVVAPLKTEDNEINTEDNEVKDNVEIEDNETDLTPFEKWKANNKQRLESNDDVIVSNEILDNEDGISSIDELENTEILIEDDDLIEDEIEFIDLIDDDLIEDEIEFIDLIEDDLIEDEIEFIDEEVIEDDLIEDEIEFIDLIEDDLIEDEIEFIDEEVIEDDLIEDEIECIDNEENDISCFYVKLAVKDKDLMSDTGGISKRRKPATKRPPRVNERDNSRERLLTKDNSTDIDNDPDLNL